MVTIGGSSVPVVTNTGSTLRIETTAFSGEGWATVEVVNPDGTYGSEPNGFHFWLDGTGQAGALGLLHWVDLVGGYWSAGSPSGFGAATVYFTQPNDYDTFDFFSTGMDQCVDDTWSSGVSFMAYDFGVSSMRLQSTTSTVLPWDADINGFRKDELIASDYGPGRDYTLQAIPGDESPVVDTPFFVDTPLSTTVSSPDIGGFSPPSLFRSQSFVWSSGAADAVLIEMIMLDATSTAVDQSITCLVWDDGYFTVPSSAWPYWPTGRQVNVFVSKLQEASGILAFNNSESRVLGATGVMGAGISY